MFVTAWHSPIGYTFTACAWTWWKNLLSRQADGTINFMATLIGTVHKMFYAVAGGEATPSKLNSVKGRSNVADWRRFLLSWVATPPLAAFCPSLLANILAP